MNNKNALSNLRHSILTALVDFRYAIDPEEWEVAKLEATQVLEEIITQRPVA